MIQNTSTPVLTESQVEHYNTFGVLVRRNLFTAEILVRIL